MINGLIKQLSESVLCFRNFKYLIVTWYDKKGPIAHLQVLRYDDLKFLKCYSLPMIFGRNIHSIDKIY